MDFGFAQGGNGSAGTSYCGGGAGYAGYLDNQGAWKLQRTRC